MTTITSTISAADNLLTQLGTQQGQSLIWNGQEFEPNSALTISTIGNLVLSSKPSAAQTEISFPDSTLASGGDLLIKAQNSLSTGNNLSGGNLILSSGNSTGLGQGNIEFWAASTGVTGSSPNVSTKVLDLSTSTSHTLAFNPTKAGVINLSSNASNNNGQALSIEGGASGPGTNLSGGSLNLKAGTGTGSGVAAQILFSCPQVSATAAATQPLSLLAQMSFTGLNTTEFNLRGTSNNNITTSSGAPLSLNASGSGGLNIGNSGTGRITVGTATKVTTIRGFVKKAELGLLNAIASANTIVPANTSTSIVWATPFTLNGSITAPSTTQFNIPREGTWQIILDVSLQSATADARGLVTMSFLPGTTPSGAANFFKAIRLPVANANVESSVVWNMRLTTAVTISIVVTMTAASQVNATATTVATATATRISIIELG